MEPTSDAILQAAMLLPENERLALVSRLLESVHCDDMALSVDDPEFLEELDRRFADREGAIAWSKLRDET